MLHVPAKQFHALQAATYHIFASNVVSELYPGKITIRSDLLKQIFDFLDQITVTRQYPALEQVNQQARGIGNNITFWNRLRSICPKSVIYNGADPQSAGRTVHHFSDARRSHAGHAELLVC